MKLRIGPLAKVTEPDGTVHYDQIGPFTEDDWRALMGASTEEGAALAEGGIE